MWELLVTEFGVSRISCPIFSFIRWSFIQGIQACNFKLQYRIILCTRSDKFKWMIRNLEVQKERRSYGIAEPPGRPLPRFPLDVFVQRDVFVEGRLHLLQSHVVAEVMVNRHHAILGTNGDLKNSKSLRFRFSVFYPFVGSSKESRNY